MNKTSLSIFIKAILHSYGQVFFSRNLILSVIMLMVSFFDWVAGSCGLIAVLTSVVLSYYLGFNRELANNGQLAFNSLLVGLGLGIFYEPGAALYLIVIFASILSLFVSVSLLGVLGKYTLPYLSIPFLIAIWTSFLASRQFSVLGISERGIYTINELYLLGGKPLLAIYEWWNAVSLPQALSVYFISLSAILFQYNLLAGILLAIGLLIYSRIAFTVSLLGFFTAYGFYELIGANLSTLNYSYIGFNYILTSIAIGSFFVIPSKASYAWVILLTPIIAMFTVSLTSLFSILLLPIYSLPFNLMVLLFLYVLKFRKDLTNHPREVYIQHDVPEKNLYAFQSNALRFNAQLSTAIQLPFFGEWKVMQGHQGEYTHQGHWQHAWDFIITRNDDAQYKNQGDFPDDYFCYGKAVIAPADGVVEIIVDEIPDNTIGHVNLEQNWGNAVVIKHAENLYSSLNHLKPGSIKCEPGERVKRGQIIASVGNSGRSAYPHLHFQLQATPYVGSATLEYPVSHYISGQKQFSLHSYSLPKKDNIVSNPEKNTLLEKAFNLVPGKILIAKPDKNSDFTTEEWEISTTEYNIPYIKTTDNQSRIYFKNDGRLFYFTHFEGSRKSLLYHFFLAGYKIMLSYYDGLITTDYFPVNKRFSKAALFFQDFIAPFYIFLKSRFELRYVSIDNTISPEIIELETTITEELWRKKLHKQTYNLQINKSGYIDITLYQNNKKFSFQCFEKSL